MNRAIWYSIFIVTLALTPVATARADELVLTLATAAPAPNPDTIEVFMPWAERVRGAAKDAVRIDIRDGVALANPTNLYDRVASDVAQIGVLIPSLVGGKFPLTDVVGLPFVNSDARNASIAFWRLVKTGMLGAEYKDIVPLGFALFPPQGVHLTKAPASLDDLQGLRLRVVSKAGSESVARLAGTPLVLDPLEQYASLQRGMLDGVVSSWMGMGVLHLTEVTAFHVETSLGTGMFMVFMMRAKYESLPPAIRQAIDQNSGEALSRAMGEAFEARSLKFRAPAAAAPDKHKIVSLSSAQSEKWRATIAPVIENWTNTRPGGAKLLETYRAILADLKTSQ
jgi:TRAP-type C4-dicarboxylate transport system substrate-binding protein